MVKDLIELWRMLTIKVLASVLVDDGAVFPVMEIISSNTDLLSPEGRPIWRGVLQCVETNTPPTIEAVAARLNGASKPGTLQSIARKFDEDDNRNLIYNTQHLKRLGIWANAREIGKKLATIENPDELDDVVSEVNSDLSGLYADKNDRNPSAQSSDEAAWSEVEQFSGRSIPTGLKWFDRLGGGFWPGMNYLIAAAYKSGKSTLMRNLVLHAAQNGYPVAAYCAEGTRELFTLDCQAMLAAQILVDAWGFEVKDNLRLSGMFILNSWRKHQDKPIFSSDEYEAIMKARKMWQGLPIRVYDTRDGIRDLTTLQYLIKRDKMKHGTIATYADYSQLFGNGKTLFERQSTTALKVQEIAQNEGIVFCMLAQKNEEGVKSGNASYSPSVKGGGDAAAAADGIFIPAIDEEMRHILRIELKLSRHTRVGKGAHHIDPNSGQILRELNITKFEQS